MIGKACNAFGKSPTLFLLAEKTPASFMKKRAFECARGVYENVLGAFAAAEKANGRATDEKENGGGFGDGVEIIAPVR